MSTFKVHNSRPAVLRVPAFRRTSGRFSLKKLPSNLFHLSLPKNNILKIRNFPVDSNPRPEDGWDHSATGSSKQAKIGTSIYVPNSDYLILTITSCHSIVITAAVLSVFMLSDSHCIQSLAMYLVAGAAFLCSSAISNSLIISLPLVSMNVSDKLVFL